MLTPERRRGLERLVRIGAQLSGQSATELWQALEAAERERDAAKAELLDRPLSRQSERRGGQTMLSDERRKEIKALEGCSFEDDERCELVELLETAERERDALRDALRLFVGECSYADEATCGNTEPKCRHCIARAALEGAK
jgi:hypothetical protein